MGIIGDVLAASYNPQLAVWSHAPGAVEMEAWLIRYFGERLGMGDNAQGSFTSGGAEANAMAIHLALTKAFPEFGSNGLRGVSGDPIVYISVESHHAWVKIAHACGIGRGSVRHIPVSDDLKMNVEVLKATIAEDHRNGKRPVLIAATAGTTSAGVIDLLPDVAKVAREADAFFHVDAAWGGSAILSDVLREHFVGIDHADSVTIDAHKWLSVPMGAGMFITPHRALLNETYRVSTAYMPDAVDATVDPYTNSNQWSRRFIGLKLFLTMMTTGRTGYIEQLHHDVQLGSYLRERLLAEGWQLSNDTPLPVVCFNDPDHLNDGELHQRIVDDVLQSGEAWISVTSVAGLLTIRACITSHRTTSDDVDRLVELVGAARQHTRT
jgi:glutamate/tyrosine decarboxylase-like PLP-dependent enzyme